MGRFRSSSVSADRPRARGKPVICFAHVTNTMAQSEGDFEKGEAGGSIAALAVILAAARAWLARPQ